MSSRDNILVDIDHVLSNAFWRDAMIGGDGGWDAYHAANKDDAPIADVVDMINGLSAKYNIIALTARPGKWRKQTMEWLLRHSVLIDEILLRPDDDYRPAPALKMALATERFAPQEIKDCVAFLLDDREDVCAAFNAIGITTLQVRGRRE